MKVNVGVVGRFHAFDLARELKRHNVLNKLITTYPKFVSRRWGLDNADLISELPLELINRYKNKIPLIPNARISNYVHKRHATNCIKYLDECDIYIGWSGSSLETLIEAKKRGKVTILERGSSHYSYQMQILQQERNGVSQEFEINYETWQRELLEYELANFISIPSFFVKRTFLENGIDEKKLVVNPYGVQLDDFTQVSKEDDVFRIIFAGAGLLRKGYHLLLQAFYELNLPNCELWHLGNVADEVKPFLEKYKHESWLLKGHVPQHELYKYYSQGSVFVLPSLEEGFAMVQFQAMACGLPLICSTNTGGEDLITEDGEEGFVIPIRDVSALKEKILYLYDNQNRAKEMGQKAKEVVSNDFTWEKYGDRYIANLLRVKKACG